MESSAPPVQAIPALTARGKHSNIAATAVARELIAFMWAIAREAPINN